LKRRLFGTYHLREDGEVTIDWHYPENAAVQFKGNLKISEGVVSIKGAFGEDSIRVALKRSHI
jgi:hypothetical protein